MKNKKKPARNWLSFFWRYAKELYLKNQKTMKFRKAKKNICLWCEEKKTGNFILAYDVKGLVNCWCCFECYKKLAPKLKVNVEK